MEGHMGVRESKVEKYLNSEVKKLSGVTRKWVSPGYSGVPDRIVILTGVIWFVEVKTRDGKMSPEQTREHKRLTDCGANVITIYGNEGVDQFTRDLLFND